MVDILKRGPALGEKIYVANCAKCGSQLRWSEAEAAIEEIVNTGTFSYINCPVCGERVCCGINHFLGHPSSR
jgi:endogenous inhibitor of DNA gyrase (YacG/DUF329 family)